MDYIIVQNDYVIGDLSGNTSKIINEIEKHKESKSYDILIFSELAISGYPPLDLLDKREFIDEQLEKVESIIKTTENNPCLVIFGYIERNPGAGKALFNSVMVCREGKKLYNYRKQLLPTYDIFDEARYFQPGKDIGIFSFQGQRIGLLICEDLWYENKVYEINPVQELFNAKADVVISINASPSIVGKYEQRITMICSISRSYNLPIVYCNQTGGNDDIIFDGNSFVVNGRGVIVAIAKKFEEDVLSVPAMHFYDFHIGNAPTPFRNQNQFFLEQAVYGIQSYIHKCSFDGVVIGESGGIDSAVVSALATLALGPNRVFGVTMPSLYSSVGSYQDSELLCKNLGITLYTFPIEGAFRMILNQFNDIFPEKKSGLMEENLQARIRGQMLMSFSNRYNCLVLSTGNKSEMSVGYSTVGGDLMGGMAPISDLYKMEVYAVAQYINEFYGNGKEIIPRVIIDKAPSAELAPDQKDSDSLPPYPILDAILKILIEGEVLPLEEYHVCKKIYDTNPEAVTKVKGLIRRAEFKRRLAPITIKMHQKAFGYGRRIPIAQKWEG